MVNLVLYFIFGFCSDLLVKSESLMLNQTFQDQTMPPQIADWSVMPRHLTLVSAPNHVTTLHCSATGRPAPSVVWQLNGVVIYSQIASLGHNSNKSSLTVVSPGVYRCLAVNPLGVAVSDVAMVTKTTSVPVGPAVLKSVVCRAGDSLQLECHAPRWQNLDSNAAADAGFFTWHRLVPSTGRVHTVPMASDGGARVGIDPATGALLFASVQPADGDGMIYRCGARNPTLRRIVDSRQSYKLSVLPASLSSHGGFEPVTLSTPVKLMAHSPANTTASRPIVLLSGASLTLFCFFSGNPLSAIGWQFATVDGNWLSQSAPGADGTVWPKHRIVDQGTGLLLLDAASAHTGRYRCVALSNTTEFAEFHILTVDRPRWHSNQPPAHATIGLGDSLKMRCQAVSVTACRWTSRNGVHLNKILATDVVMVTNNASYTDRAVYQCNCSSQLTGLYLYANVYVNVVARPPLIDKAENQSIMHWAWTKSHARLPCRSTPRGSKIEWTRQLLSMSEELVIDYLNNSRYRLTDFEWDGLADLTISELTINDSGVYRCRVINRFGSESHWLNLTVLQAARIINGPAVNQSQSLNIVKGAKDIRLRCRVGVDSRLASLPGSDGAVSVSLSWFKDGLPLESAVARTLTRHLNPNDIVDSGDFVQFEDWLDLSPMKLSYAGSYACTVSTMPLPWLRHTPDPGDVSEYVRLSIIEPPLAPRSLRLISCQSGIALLTWLNATGRTDSQWRVDNRPEYYDVQFSEQYSNYLVWHSIADCGFIVSQSQLSCRVNLLPSLAYRFRVRGVNKAGFGPPIEPPLDLASQTDCLAAPRPPSANPTDLRVDGDDKFDDAESDTVVAERQPRLRIRWHPVWPLSINGPGFAYLIYVACHDCRLGPRIGVEEFVTRIKDPRQSQIVLTSLSIGDSVYPIEPYRLYRVKVHTVNQLGNCCAKPQQSSVTSTSSTQSAAAMGVKTTAAPAAAVVVAMGRSSQTAPEVAPQRLRLLKTVPDAALKLTESKTAIEGADVWLAWDMPVNPQIDGRINGAFRGYRVEWCRVVQDRLDAQAANSCQIQQQASVSTSRGQAFDILSGDVTELRVADFSSGSYCGRVSGLPGNALLNIRLRALNSANLAGPASGPSALTVRTGIARPGQVGEFALLGPAGADRLELAWTAPTGLAGTLTGFLLAWSEIRGLRLLEPVRLPPISDPAQSRATLAGLQPGAAYRVYLAALSLAGDGPPACLDVRTVADNHFSAFSVSTLPNGGLNVTSLKRPFRVQYRAILSPNLLNKGRFGQGQWFETRSEDRLTWLVIDGLTAAAWYEVRTVSPGGVAYGDWSRIRTSDLGRVGPHGEDSSNDLLGGRSVWLISFGLLLAGSGASVACLCCLQRRGRRRSDQIASGVGEGQVNGGTNLTSALDSGVIGNSWPRRQRLQQQQQQQLTTAGVARNGARLLPYNNDPHLTQPLTSGRPELLPSKSSGGTSSAVLYQTRV